MNSTTAKGGIKNLNKEQRLAYQLVQETNKSFFLTGKAGTGKTTFVKYIQETLHKRFVIVAPTGLAAITAGGQTIHSFFGLPLGPIAPDTEFDVFNINYEKQLLLKKVNTIIIDEVSMVRCDIVDAIDSILKHVMRNSMPFGGKQVIFVGDLYQLEPIVEYSDEEMLNFFNYHYYTDKPYFYQARVFQLYQLPCIEFSTVYRQTDQKFLQMLGHIRLGRYVKDEIDVINHEGISKDITECLCGGNKKNDVTLTPFNKTADDINSMELSKISNPSFTYAGKLEGEFNRKNFPVPYELVLKEGAQIMFCRNDRDQRWVNGTIGMVSSLTDDSISVSINGKVVEVGLETWEVVKYVFNKETRKLDKEVIGTYTQYPLKLAWAITIHKSQGLTFDNVTLDPQGIFAAGQLYVALSRVRSLKGLSLLNSILPEYIYEKRDVVEFMNRYGNLETIQSDITLYKPAMDAISHYNFDEAASYLLEQVLEAIKKNNIQKAWYCACQMMPVLYIPEIFKEQTNIALLSGDDEKTLFLNTIISICNRNFSIAVALAERGIKLNVNTDFDYLKCIALYMNSRYEEAVFAIWAWRNNLKKHNKVLDDRLLFLFVKNLKNRKQKLQSSQIAFLQTMIRHMPRYLSPMLFLKNNMNTENLKLETDEDESHLVDMFNQTISDHEFQTALVNASVEERKVLLRAILNYPYE